jgi:hypothetical protein
VKFSTEYIQWKKKMTCELSKYYFLNESNEEISKRTTGLNYKSDIFYHSVFIRSDFFNNYYPPKPEKDDEQISLYKDDKKTYSELLKGIKSRLLLIRKEYLVDFSESIIDDWEANNILPRVEDLTIAEDEYKDVVREVYIAVPQLFTNAGEEQKKVILRLLGSLMGTEERDDILNILEQVYELSPEDKEALMSLLSKTSLSCIIRTVKEVDHRVQVIEAMEEILFDAERRKTTKEVEHLQKILDENFWIFGDEFRLFSTTEGPVKKTLEKYKNEILHKENEKILTESKKELDLFISKYDVVGNKHTGVVVEIKRPSIRLGKKEFDQLEEYMLTIIKEPSCNGNNMEWFFYLIGNDYDDYIQDKIRNSNLGEQDKGLVYRDNSKNVKYYIRKWSDIINVDQKSRYKFLREKLMATPENLDNKSTTEIVRAITSA